MEDEVQKQNVCSFCGKVINPTDISATGNDNVIICQDCVSNLFEMMSAMQSSIHKNKET